MALLEVKNLEVYYGVICALKGISFEVNEGEIVSLIGANGAGKTTVMQSVVGLIPKKNGTVTFDGMVMEARRLHLANTEMDRISSVSGKTISVMAQP